MKYSRISRAESLPVSASKALPIVQDLERHGADGKQHPFALLDLPHPGLG